MKRSVGLMSMAIGALSFIAAPTAAQMTGQQGAMSILNRLPPDVYAKIQALALILDQSIKEGKLSESDVQRDLLSGQLGDRLQSINPEAGRMLDEISEAMKQGNGPGPESLMPLLGGLR